MSGRFNGAASPDLQAEADALRGVYRSSQAGGGDVDWSGVDEITIQGRRYLRYPNGTWADDAGKVIDLRAVLPRPQDPDQEPLVGINPAILEGRAVPQRRWIVPGWVPRGRASGLFGVGGAGKTTLAQMLCTAGAIGDDWLGLPVTHCRSVLLFGEDDLEEMHIRQEHINRHYNCSYTDISDCLWLPRLGEDNCLMRFENGRVIRTPFFDRVLSRAKDHGADLFIGDALADLFFVDENNRMQARACVQEGLAYLARELDAGVIACGHPSRTGISTGSGDSGSTGWVASFRSHLYCAKDGITGQEGKDGEPVDPRARTLRLMKATMAQDGYEIELRWNDAGLLLPTRQPTGIIGSIERGRARRIFLEMLDRTIAQGRRVSASRQALNYAPAEFARRPERDGLRKADLVTAMEELFSDGTIVMGAIKGADRHDHPCIVRST